ncbi:hypothetical protein CK203_083759 [Vitis vinifera]|uniref:J domain-containing protein n=1 Tax=Vitis vinifera TaxID=29760 RepID=A0A438F0K7_VITVI|nr:hypothetical protein CK203_083759 [Vitis vinifera]
MKQQSQREGDDGVFGSLHSTLPINTVSKSVTNLNGFNFPATFKTSLSFSSSSTSRFTVNCRDRTGEEPKLSDSSAYAVLGVDPSCSAAELKAAFRAKVKQFHPDVNKEGGDSDKMIRLVIQAYELLSCCSRSEIIERECLDPFDEPECEAFDLFVNEVLCVGKGMGSLFSPSVVKRTPLSNIVLIETLDCCPYSCVNRAPHAFTFVSSTGTARATSQGHGEDYQVQLAVGQCPRSCIHYVTPSQRIVLEELLNSILDTPYDTSVEADLLYSLIVKARFENNRYQKPKKQPKGSTQHVDWF